ncbi:hypothetical protein HQ545_08845 [Candidatus Woesearchaeota archaeon]|nr:hypothetical protein [Candidatus Woesearchaeota archaeon]
MIKKEGDKLKQYLLHAVFVVVIAIAILFIIDSTSNITGHAVINPEGAQKQLETAFSSSSLFGRVSSASICVVINDAADPATFKAVKSAAGWTVNNDRGLCSGARSEDLIVQFSDYASFSKIVENPSPRNLANGAINRDFEILPSKNVEMGGNVVCDASFKSRFCSVLKLMASSEQLIDGDLSCCLEDITKAQRKQLEEHVAQGSYKDESGILQQPSGVASIMTGMSTIIIISIVGVIVLIGAIVGVMLKKTKKSPKPLTDKSLSGITSPSIGPTMGTTPGFSSGVGIAPRPAAPPAEDPGITELRNYVRQALSQGYAQDQVRAHLLEIGWAPATADKILNEASS